MLEFLSPASIGDATAASHHAIQVIRQWALVAPVEDYFATIGAELTPSQVKLVKQIVLDVEQHAHRPVRQLSPSQRVVYVEEISKRLLELSEQQLSLDPAKGKTLLSKLRSARRV